MTALELRAILGELQVEDPERCAFCGELASECTCICSKVESDLEFVNSLIK